MSVVEPQWISVEAKGSLVVLNIGNTPLVFEYEAAIQTSTWLKICSKAAKVAAGDRRRLWSALGSLSMLEDETPKRPIHLKRADCVDPQRIQVYTEGAVVCFQYGSAVMKMDYDSSAQLSQWLRLRGKEARNNAGDRRHWSEIGNLPAVLNGERPWGNSNG